MSDKKTVLFFPLNSPGHINSSLGIADRLREDHGYRTIFLLLGEMMGNSIVEHGHELVVVEEVGPFEDYEILPGEDTSVPVDEEMMRKAGRVKRKFSGALKWPQMIARCMHLLRMDPLEACIQSWETFDGVMVEELIKNYDNYVAEIERIKPDMIVVDAYYIPPCIVGLNDIPWARLYSANPLMLTTSKMADGIKPPPMVGYPLLTKSARMKLREEEPEKWAAMLNKWKGAFERMVEKFIQVNGPLQGFMEKHNCPPVPLGQQAHTSPHINLYMFPKELDYDQDDDILEYPPRWFRCDSLTRRTISEDQHWSERLAEAMKGKSEMIYFSMGSIASGDADLMRRFIDVLKTDQRRLYVVSKGVNGDKFELDSGNMIGGNYIPQTFFLQRADLAITHGGNNSVTECMYFGVPMLVMPVFADQLDNAQRVDDLSLGRKMNPFEWAPEDLMRTLDELLADKGLHERVRQIGVEMRARDDSKKISLILHKLCQEKTLSQEFIDDARNKNADELSV